MTIAFHPATRVGFFATTEQPSLELHFHQFEAEPPELVGVILAGVSVTKHLPTECLARLAEFSSEVETWT